MNGSAFLVALPLCWKLSKRWQVVIKIGIGIQFLLVTHLSKDATSGRFLSSSTSTSTNSPLQIAVCFMTFSLQMLDFRPSMEPAQLAMSLGHPDFSENHFCTLCHLCIDLRPSWRRCAMRFTMPARRWGAEWKAREFATAILTSKYVYLYICIYIM